MDNDPVDFRRVNIDDRPSGWQQVNRKQAESSWHIWMRECVIPVMAAGVIFACAIGGLLWWLGR